MIRSPIQYIILVPEGVRTGGPECLHQLADSLSRQGFNAVILPTRKSDLEGLQQIKEKGNLINGNTLNFSPNRDLIAEYEQIYPNVKTCSKIKLSSTTIFIIPEIWANCTALFNSWPCIIWWLSVDNAFPTMPNINWLKNPMVYHVSQSNYAEKFLSLNGLGVLGRLHDPVRLPPGDIEQKKILSSKRKIISINGGHKNIFDLERMQAKVGNAFGFETRILRNLTQEDFFAELSTSLIYIDLGNFPGRDKPPREAILRNAVPILSNTGAAFWGDFSVPDYLLLNPFKDSLISRIDYILFNPFLVAKDMEIIKKSLVNENNTFDEEVSNLFSQFAE